MVLEECGFWDDAVEGTREIFDKFLSKPVLTPTPQQIITAYFSVRVIRRTVALDSLMEVYLYNEALPLIRCAYEDWVALAYILEGDSRERWQDFKTDVSKMDAKVYNGFLELAGSASATEIFGEPPPEVTSLLDQPNRNLRPRGGKLWKAMAEDVGLGSLHDFAYVYLSNMIHGSFKSTLDVYKHSEGVQGEDVIKVQAPVMDEDDNAQWSFWTCWFNLTFLTLDGLEFCYDFESYSDDLDEISRENNDHETLATCVLVRESVSNNHI